MSGYDPFSRALKEKVISTHYSSKQLVLQNYLNQNLSDAWIQSTKLSFDIDAKIDSDHQAVAESALLSVKMVSMLSQAHGSNFKDTS